MAPKKIRVHELSKELGLTSKELLALAQKLGIGASSPSASIEDAQADRIRRRADADGLRRAVPADADKAEKAAVATKTTKSAAPEAPAPPPLEAPVRVTRAVAPVAPMNGATETVAPAAAAPTPEVVAPPAAKVVRSRVVPPKPAPIRTASPDGPTTIRPTQRGGAADGEGSNRPPLSSTGRPIPPPPGRPMSSTGRPIPPPPGVRRPLSAPGARSGPSSGPRPMSARPSTGAPRTRCV